MHALTTDTTFWYACAFVRIDVHFCLLCHLYKVIVCLWNYVFVVASRNFCQCWPVRHYWSVITCKMMREQVREILNQWTKVPSVKTSPGAVRVSKAIYRRRDEMRCGLSFEAPTWPTIQRNLLPPLNKTYLYCCCVLCLFICLTGFQT